MKKFVRFLFAIVLGLLAAGLHAAGNLKVTLAPAAAASAGAQWRVDSGAWQSSGATVKGLTGGAHAVDFKITTGWIAPSSTTANVVNGSTTSLTATYVQAASVTLTLAPNTAQWRIDAGAWQNSGATVQNLAPGSHPIEYSAVPGYQAPANETVTLAAGNALTLQRSYIQYAQLSATLSPTTAQWRVNGGNWLASGASVSLLPGSYTVDYAAVSGYTAPASEAVALTAGQVLGLSRGYVQLAQLSVTLSPASAQWRLDGGAWLASGTTVSNLALGTHSIEYASLSGYSPPASESVSLTAGQSLVLTRSYVQFAQLTVALAPNTAQWRVNGGAWLASGASVSLLPGSYTVDYAAVSGYTAPASEAVALTAGQVLGLSRSYVQLAQLSVTLSPASAQWRFDGGAWLASGTTVSNLALGTHSIEYASLSGYTTPAAESVSLTAGQSLVLARSYVQLAQVTISLTPTTAQWRVDGGTWLGSGATLANLTPGTHAIDYAAVAGYITPASEPVTLTAGQALALTRTYVQLAQLTITLSHSSGQWRIDGGAWQASGASVANLVPGDHAVEYSSLNYYITPANETVTLVAGQSLALTRTYVRLAQILIGLSPSSGQWRANGGAWLASGTSLWVPAGTYAIEYSTLDSYTAPPSETLVLDAGGLFATTRYYTSQKPTLQISLQPNTGQWRIDGGAWQASGARLSELNTGAHTIDYLDIGGDYAPLASESITLNLLDHVSLARTYPLKPAQITVDTTPAQGAWAIYPDVNAPNQNWNPSGTTLAGLAPGSYYIGYKPVVGYTTPAATAVTLAPGEIKSLTTTYSVAPAQITVNLYPSSAQWRVDGGPWQASGATVVNLTPGTPHTIDYGPVDGYATLPSESLTLAAGEQQTWSRSYPLLTGLTINLYPMTAQWRVDSGAWLASGATVSGLASDVPHTIEYAPAEGYATPASETITLAVGQQQTLYRYYPALAQLTIMLYPSAGQWRVDGGAWQNSGAIVANLAFDVPHNIEYSAVPGYIAPPAESVTLYSGQQQSLYRSYLELAKITVTLYPSTARWRVDGGAWQPSGTRVTGLAAGDHTLDYEPVTGYVAPPSDTVSLYQGQDFTTYRYYANVPQFKVTLTPSTGQWRVDGGAWQPSDATVYVTSGIHTVEYGSLAGYLTPPRETYQLSDGEMRYLSTSYVAAGRLSLTLTPSNAQWRVDEGPWQASGAVADNLWPGYHRIDYSDVTAYITPGYEMINVPGGQLTSLTRTYTGVAQISITTYPSSTKWRVNGGEWYLNGMTYTLPQSGNYTVDYLTPDTYQPIPSEVVTLTTGQLVTLTRYSPSVTSPDAGQLIIHANPSSVPDGYAQFAVDLGSYTYAGWYVCGHPVPLPAGRHSILFAQGSVGWLEPAPLDVDIVAGSTTELTVTFHPVNHVRFFIDQSLAGAMTTDELARRLGQYSADLNTIFSRESLRQIQFDSYYDVSVVTADPFTTSPSDFYAQTSLWVYIRATDNASIGTYGGRPALDVSGVAGGTDFKWDQVYDPATLTAGSPELEQYWRQLHNLTRVLELSFGAGAGEYASLGGMKDLSGVAPLVADTAAADSATADPFWATRTEYWADPLTANAWNNPRLGSPLSLDALVGAVHFAPISSKLVSENARGADRQAATLPNLSNVTVHVVDAQTGQPIAASAVRVWNRSDPTAATTTFEETVTTTGSGAFSFSWTDASTALTSMANAKLIKASASGYASTAQWVTIYDAQKAKMIDGQASFDVTVALTPQ